jgi:hypothetical protein
MKPNKSQKQGPERQTDRKTGGGEAESRPESQGRDTAQNERLEKEQEIQEGRGAGEEGGRDDDAEG